MKTAASVALVLYLLYSIGFALEGYRARGSMGLKTLGLAAELAVFTALIWVIQS